MNTTQMPTLSSMNAFSIIKITALLWWKLTFTALLNEHGPQKKDKVQTYTKLVHRISTEKSQLK